MITVFEIPKEAFRGHPPFSVILVDGEAFNHSDRYLTSLNNFIEMLYLCTGGDYSDMDENHFFFSLHPCTIKMEGIHVNNTEFFQHNILTINKDTGAWMLRKPYSEIYP